MRSSDSCDGALASVTSWLILDTSSVWNLLMFSIVVLCWTWVCCSAVMILFWPWKAFPSAEISLLCWRIDPCWVSRWVVRFSRRVLVVVLLSSRILRREVVSLMAAVMAVFLLTVASRSGGRLDFCVVCLGDPVWRRFIDWGLS